MKFLAIALISIALSTSLLSCSDNGLEQANVALFWVKCIEPANREYGQTILREIATSSRPGQKIYLDPFNTEYIVIQKVN